MAERIVLILNGGADLGAYQCGVYQTLVEHLGPDALRSMVIAGASIGAVNGFLIAAHSHEPDAGAATLGRFWHSVAQPSLPFFPIPHPYWERVNASLTGLAMGNHGIFSAVPGGLVGGLMAYPHMAMFNNAPLVRTLSDWSAGLDAAAETDTPRPRVMMRALDLMAAEPVWFDSDETPIVPAMAACSTAVPLVFEPHWYEGRAYWDGDIWHQGVLAPALARLDAGNNGQGADSADGYHVITVEMFSREPGAPVGLGAAIHQLRMMFLGSRCDRDAADALARGDVRLTRVRRNSLPHEQASMWLMDWAPERIADLISQGREDAAKTPLTGLSA